MQTISSHPHWHLGTWPEFAVRLPFLHNPWQQLVHQALLYLSLEVHFTL